jgi:chaperonin GroES
MVYFVVPKIKDTLTSTEGGILLPDQAQERPTEGVVIEAGPGKLHPFTGVRITNPIRKGVSVVFGKYEGTPVNYNDEDCQMIRDDNVLLYYEGARMKLDNVVPVRDYVLVQLDEAKDTLQTSSGVVIAAAVQKDQTQCEGVVVKVGEGRMASLGNITPSPVQEGDRVKFKDYAGNELSIEGKPFAVVKMVDILSSLNEE